MAKNPMRTPKITTTKTIKMNKPTNGSQPIKNEQSGTKELSFEVLKNAILKHRASSQYIQASIIILRDIFEDDTIQGANFAKQPHLNEWVKCCERLPKDFTSVLVSDGNTRTTALYQDGLFYPDFLLEHQEVKYWMPLPHPPKK